MEAVNLIKLRVLLLIRKYQKVSEVGRVLGLRQPTISFHMKSLEQEYQLPLFRYRSGNVILTKAGEALSHYAQRIIDLWDEAERINEEFVTMDRGSLALGASYVPAAYVIPEALRQFKLSYPKLSLSLTVRSAPFILELLTKQQLDLGIISAVPELPDGFMQKELAREELVLVFPSCSPLAALGSIEAGDLEQADLIVHGRESTTRKLVDGWITEHQLNFSRMVEVDSLEVIKKLLISGWGYSILSRLAVAEEIQRGRLQWAPLPGGPIHRGIYLIHHEEHWVSPAMTQFMQLCRSFWKATD